MKVFVIPDILPTLLGAITGYYLYPDKGLVVSLETVLIGLAVHAIMLLYRVITGFVAIMQTFKDLPTQYTNINNIMARVLSGPGTRPGR